MYAKYVIWYKIFRNYTIPLIRYHKKKNPNTPIILVDCFKAPFSVLNNKVLEWGKGMDNALKGIEYQKMILIMDTITHFSLNALGDDQEGIKRSPYFLYFSLYNVQTPLKEDNRFSDK